MSPLIDVYREYVVDLDPVLWEMGRVNGVPLDNDRRLALLSEMDARLQRLQDDAQPYVPDHLFPVVRRTTRPTDGTVREVRVEHPNVKTCARCGAQPVTKANHTARKRDNPCYGAEIVLRPGWVTAYDVVLPFNPGSDDQLRAYAASFGHPLGRNWRTGQDTLDAKQLQKLIDRYGESHPLYRLVAELRKVRKARGYAAAWVPDHRGRVYGTFKHAPETFRLSQANHNFMNVSHRGDVPYGEELRSLLVAPPGYVLLEADSSAVEAVFTGYFVGDAEYLRLARRGIHAWWACRALGLEPTPDNLHSVKHAEEHRALYERKKRTVHGVSYGMGAALLHATYPDLFPAVWVDGEGHCRGCRRAARRHLCPTYTAQQEIDEFYALVPALKQWQTEIQQRAHKQGYLQSPWGIRNYFYRVFSYDWRTKTWRLGEDAKAAVAFLPQHANGMFQRKNLVLIHEAIRKMGKQGIWWQPANGHVHDSAGVMVPDTDIDRAATMLAEILHRPIPELGGLQVGVTVKVGSDWGHMRPLLTVE